MLARCDSLQGYVNEKEWAGYGSSHPTSDAFLSSVSSFQSFFKAASPAASNFAALEKSARSIIKKCSVPISASLASASVRAMLQDVLNFLTERDSWIAFLEPVPKAVMGYRSVIKNPMCYSDIAGKLGDGKYDGYKAGPSKDVYFQIFEEDVELVYSNCEKFNKNGRGGGQAYADYARAQRRHFQAKMREVRSQAKKAEGDLITGKCIVRYDAAGKSGVRYPVNCAGWLCCLMREAKPSLEKALMEHLKACSKGRRVPEVTPAAFCLALANENGVFGNEERQVDLSYTWLEDLLCSFAEALTYAQLKNRSAKGGDLELSWIKGGGESIEEPKVSTEDETAKGLAEGFVRGLVHQMCQTCNGKDGAEAWLQVIRAVEVSCGFSYKDDFDPGRVENLSYGNGVLRDSEASSVVEEFVWKKGGEDREDRLKVLENRSRMGNTVVTCKELQSHLKKLIALDPTKALNDREVKCVRNVTRRFPEKVRAQALELAGIG